MTDSLTFSFPCALSADADGYTARCLTTDLSERGPTEADARDALAARLERGVREGEVWTWFDGATVTGDDPEPDADGWTVDVRMGR